MRIAAFIAAFLFAGIASADIFTPISTYIVTGITTPVGQKTSDPIGGAEAGPTIVRLVCTVDCFVAVSHAFTTTANSVPVYLPLDKPWEIKIQRGNTIIVVQDTTTGDLHITELSK